MRFGPFDTAFTVTAPGAVTVCRRRVAGVLRRVLTVSERAARLLSRAANMLSIERHTIDIPSQGHCHDAV